MVVINYAKYCSGGNMKLSRRNFLKTSAAGLAAYQLSVGGSIRAEAKELLPSDYGYEKKVHLSCRMCAQLCPMEAQVKDGRLIRIGANPNTRYPAVCGRGRAAISALYNNDRIKAPLIRVGERGSGEFRRATWEEALDLVGSKMKELRDNNEAHTMAYLPRFNTAPGLDNKVIEMFGCFNYISYADTCYASANELGLGAVFGGGKVPRASVPVVMGDYENAKVAVLLNRNPAGGLVAFPWGAMFGRGRKNGLKTFIVDPRRPHGVGESDGEWLPVIPGTDPILLTALAREIITKKYYDEEFLRKHTNAEMLVSAEDGKPFSIINPFEKEADYMVYDESLSKPVLKKEATKPALFGNFEIDGKKVKTAMQALADSCQDMTPEKAKDLCGIAPEQIIKLAEELNAAKPACFIERGYRTTRYFNSTKGVQFVAMINAMLGVYGQKGGLIYQRGVKMGSPIKGVKSEEINIAKHYAKNEKGFELINLKECRRILAKSIMDGRPYPVKMLFINGQNLIGGSAGGIDIANSLHKVPFILSITPYWNETALYSDVILPDTTFMERDEPLTSGYKTYFPVISVNEKAVEPLFDVKNGYDIILELAKRFMSKEEYDEKLGAFEKGGIEYIIEHQLQDLKGITDEEKAGITRDLLKNLGVWTGDDSKYGAKNKENTTNKFEIYSTFMLEWNEKLKSEKRDDESQYFTPDFTYADTHWQKYLKEKNQADLLDDEFIAITGFHPLSSFTGAQTRNNIVLKNVGETLDYDAVFINKAKGEALGLKDNDIVEIVNVERPDAAIQSKVRLTHTVEPHTLFSFYGVGNGYYTKLGEKLSVASKIGFNPNHINNFLFSPVDGTAPCHDFIVKIRKVK